MPTLKVKNNGIWETVSGIGGSGGSVNAVLYTAQTLTEEQKAQVRANIGISETSKIPTFNLTEMGLPAVNYGSGETVLVDTNAQALLEALLDGPVKIKYQFYGDATSGQVVDSEVVVCANAISGYDVAQATFVTDTNGFFMNSLVVSSERITLGSTIASNGGSGNVPSAEGVGF